MNEQLNAQYRVAPALFWNGARPDADTREEAGDGYDVEPWDEATGPCVPMDERSDHAK